MEITSIRAFNSWNFPRLVDCEESALVYYKTLGELGFAERSLLLDFASGKMYLVSENKLRRITNPDWLDVIGARYDDFITVSEKELKLNELGDDLT